MASSYEPLPGRSPFPPIAEYGFLSDTETVALCVEADERYAERFEDVACDVCGATAVETVYASTLTEHDLEHSLEQHTYSGWTNAAGRIVACRACRLRFVSPRERASGISRA